MVGIVSAGIGSGLDVGGLVEQLLAAEAAPVERRLATREASTLARISSFGSVKSALSEFQSALESLTDAEALLGRTVTLEENDFFTVTANNDSAPADFDVEVLEVASAQKLSSAAYVGADSTVGNGTLVLSSGSNSFAVDIVAGADSLADIRDAINAQADNSSIRATIVNTDAGAYLTLSALDTGTGAKISVVASGGDGGLSALEYDSATATGSLSEIRAATDASIRIDGQAVTSGSNTISDAIEGVTIELTAADPGVLRSVGVGYDRAALTGKLEEFVAAYNAVLEVFDNETRFNAETSEAGPLLGDSTLRSIRDQLRRSFGDALADTTAPARTLSDIGISITVEGRAELDTEKLESFLDTGFTAVGTLFGADDGVAVRLDALVSGYLESDSALEARTDGLEATIDDIGEQREALQQRLVTLEERLLRQFNALDQLVSELTNTSNFLTQQLSQLPGSGN